MRRESFFFNIKVQRDRVLNAALPDFKELQTEGVLPLVKMFRRGMGLDADSDLAPQPYDPTTYGGLVTFHIFMDTIGRKPRAFVPRPTQAL
jgi:hypothetical protein